jgi:hypothetical protein
MAHPHISLFRLYPFVCPLELAPAAAELSGLETLTFPPCSETHPFLPGQNKVEAASSCFVFSGTRPEVASTFAMSR